MRTFTPTKWATARDKTVFYRQFVKFVQSDFDAKYFTRPFYQRLSNTFGHIAHYNQSGFWETWFTTTADKVRFLKLTLRYPCYGDPAWTFSDVETALQAWLTKEKILQRYTDQSVNEPDWAALKP